MIKKALLMDAKQFAKKKQIRAKRPSEYWLIFIKRNVFTYKEPWFRLYYLVFLIPVLAIVFILVTNINNDAILPIAFISSVVSFFIFAFIKVTVKKPLVPLNVFQALANFIISIKGDVHKNLIGLSINSGALEDDVNTLDTNKIGLKSVSGVKYEAYQMERFKANFTLKDGSVCLVSMHQIVVRVSTTKRRSSGKVKTKMKRKHKFFYQLALKIKTSDYKIIQPKDLLALNENYVSYDITTKDDGAFCWVKIKSKKKLLKVETLLNPAIKHRDSIFTDMMELLIEYKVMEPRASTKSIKY